MLTKLAASLAALVALAAAQSGLQRVAVRGSLFCGDRIARNISIELWDFDTTVRGDLMGKTTTDSDGFFALEGAASDAGDDYIEPEIRIYHDCNDYANQGVTGEGICAREWIFHVPRNYINRNPRRANQPILNIGQINLELVMPKEAHKCEDEHHAEA